MQDSGGIEILNERVRQSGLYLEALRAEVGRALVGQEAMVRRLLIALLGNGHVLLEGVPGLAKTLAVRTLAEAVDTEFGRIQFTPDLLPADILGTLIYNPREGSFEVKKGPIFANIILADEINRAPAKVQSALLEAMQERQVTIGDETYPLAEPFMVLATQNPIEQEGTYQLPEAQLDRFMMKVRVTYPSRDEEREIVRRMARTTSDIEIRPVIGPAEIMASRRVVDEIYMDDRVMHYVLDLVLATRDPGAYKVKRLGGLIRYGASTRASIYMSVAAKASAFLDGRGYVLPQDVKNVAPDILRHRIIPTYEAEAEDITSDEIVRTLLEEIEVP